MTRDKISKAQIEHVVDINRDRRPDKIQCEAWEEESAGKDEEGKDVYIISRYYECAPFVRHAKKDSVFFSWALKNRKSPSELVFTYNRNYTPFLDRTGFRTFWAGQKILFGGKMGQISSFQLILNPGGSEGPTVTDPAAVLADEQTVSLDNLTLVTSKGERLDPRISVRLAKVHKDRKLHSAVFSEATVPERYFAQFLINLRKNHKKKGTDLETVSRELNSFVAHNPALKEVFEGKNGEVLFSSLSQCALRFLDISK